MNSTERKKLNKQIGCLRKSVLKLDDEDYRAVVQSIDEKSGGFIRNCDDEHANLVYLQLRQLADRRRAGGTSDRQENPRAHAKIAKLGYILRWSWNDIARFCFKETGKKSTKRCTGVELAKVINGMVAVIDFKLAKGELTMSPGEKSEYERYTKQHRAGAQRSNGATGTTANTTQR